MSGERGEEVVRDVLGALGAEALGVGGVEQRVWSRGAWRERDEYDDLD